MNDHIRDTASFVLLRGRYIRQRPVDLLYTATDFRRRQLGIQQHHPVACDFQAIFQPQPCVMFFSFCWGNAGSFGQDRRASGRGRSAVATCGPPGKADVTVECLQTEPSQVRNLSRIIVFLDESRLIPFYFYLFLSSRG